MNSAIWRCWKKNSFFILYWKTWAFITFIRCCKIDFKYSQFQKLSHSECLIVTSCQSTHLFMRCQPINNFQGWILLFTNFAKNNCISIYPLYLLYKWMTLKPTSDWWTSVTRYSPMPNCKGEVSCKAGDWEDNNIWEIHEIGAEICGIWWNF